MVANSSIQTFKTYVEMMVRYRIWSICLIIVVCSVIWFSQAEKSNRTQLVTIIGVLFAVGWASTFIAVPMLNSAISKMEEEDKRRDGAKTKKVVA